MAMIFGMSLAFVSDDSLLIMHMHTWLPNTPVLLVLVLPCLCAHFSMFSHLLIS